MSARRLLIVVVALASLASAGAFAAGLTTTSGTLASGTTALTRCDTTPTWTYNFDKNVAGEVISVTVADIDSTCAGGALSLALEPAGATGGPVTVSGCGPTCSVTVPVSGAPLPSEVTSVVTAIVGP